MKEPSVNADVIVVGGGLGGLATAVYLGQAGRKVILLERARELGGRAATASKDGFHMNLGAHALYAHGAAHKVLEELGIAFSGRKPAPGGFALARGRRLGLPVGPFSLLTSDLLGLSAKLELARLLATLGHLDIRDLHGVTVRAWLDTALVHAEARSLVEALFRLTTYTNDAERMSAAVAIGQLQSVARGNVFYLDGGWGTLVEGLSRRALEVGVRIERGARVDQVERDGRRVRGVYLTGGAKWSAPVVVVASSPRVAGALFGSDPALLLTRWASESIPVEAACLDVALSRLPAPKTRFALGIDQPVYYGQHAATARLAPEGGGLLHLVKYLDPRDPQDPSRDEAELEALLTSLQPGWHADVEARRFRPAMQVVHRLAAAADGGLPSRPGPRVPDLPGLYVVGDWVGAEGWLSDATMASAREAARLIIDENRMSTAA